MNENIDNVKNNGNDHSNSKKKLLFICILVPLFIFIFFTLSNDFENNTLSTDEKKYQIFELATQSGFDGDYEDWLLSVSGDEIELRIYGSVVQWKYKESDKWTTLYDMVDYSGKDGVNGTDGEDGKDGVDGTNGTNGKDGIDGFSAYEVWLFFNNKEDTSENMEEFFYSLNAYSLWLSMGNDGDVDTFLNSLKGETGESGADGEDGKDGVDGENGKDVGYAVYQIYVSFGYTGTYEDFVIANDGKVDLEDFDFSVNLDIFTVTFVEGESSADVDVADGQKVSYRDPNNIPNGYEFDGWYCDGEKWSFIGYVVKENVNLTAVFSPIQYEINFELNGGENNFNNTYITIADEIELKAVEMVGYEFDGWYLNDKKVATLSNISNDITLVAKWTERSNSITYYLNFGTSNAYNPSTIMINDDIITLSDSKRDGYTFLGWYNEEGNKVTKLQNISTDITLEAKWEVVYYPISYDLNGYSLEYYFPTSITIEDEIDLITLVPTKEYYNFECWQIDGETVTSLSNIESDVVLTAIWIANEYSINYVLDGGTLNGAPETFTKESAEKLVYAEKEHYIFDGWYLDSNYNNEVTSLSVELLNNNQVTLYAKYSLRIYNDDDDDIDYLYYGKYPQSEVTSSSEKNNLTNYFTFEGIVFEYSGNEYMLSSGTYYKVEAIRWDIIESQHGVYSLISNNVLASEKYENYDNISGWLNNDFYNFAFNNVEKDDILDKYYDGNVSRINLPTIIESSSVFNSLIVKCTNFSGAYSNAAKESYWWINDKDGFVNMSGEYVQYDNSNANVGIRPSMTIVL